MNLFKINLWFYSSVLFVDQLSPSDILMGLKSGLSKGLDELLDSNLVQAVGFPGLDRNSKKFNLRCNLRRRPCSYQDLNVLKNTMNPWSFVKIIKNEILNEVEQFSKTTAAKEKDRTSVIFHDITTNGQNFSTKLQTALPNSLDHTS